MNQWFTILRLPSSNSAQEIDKITNTHLFDGTFYKVISIIDNKFVQQDNTRANQFHRKLFKS